MFGSKWPAQSKFNDVFVDFLCHTALFEHFFFCLIAGKWMERQKEIILSEVIHTPKDKYVYFSLICGYF